MLTACEWDGKTGAGDVLASLIVEDFTTPDYFFKSVVARFDDATIHEAGDVLRLVWPFSESLQDHVLAELNALASPYRYGPVGSGYADLIGRTPLLKLGRLTEGCGATVLVKLECMEPGSVKDRPVLSMIEQAVERGDIRDDVEVVEASSGNVAFALSAVMGALLDRKPKIFISKMHGARLPENKGKVIVTIAHDRGDRYLEIDDLFVPPPEATEEDLSEGGTE